MTLVAPGFLLAGVLLAGIPILIHFLNRRRFREQRWAAMEFLLRAMKKNRKRLRFEQWLLLAVRCLLLGLLGLALARPVGCEGEALSGIARPAGLHVIVLDDSYSMAYQADRPGAATHLDQAKRLATTLIDQLVPGSDAVEIVTASRPARVVFSAGYDLDAARAVIGRVEQSAAATDLPGAMGLAAGAGKDAGRPGGGGGGGGGATVRELHIVSDGTRSSLLRGGLASEELQQAARQAAAAFTHLTYHHLGRSDQSHAAITEVETVSPLVTARQAQELRAVVHGYGGSELARTVQWRLDDSTLPGGSGELRVGGADGTANATLPQVKFGRAGARVVSASLAGGNDRLTLDARRLRVVEVADRVRVLLVEGERGIGGGPGGEFTSSGAFLRLALAPPAPVDAETAAPGAATPTASRSNSALEADVLSDLELQNRVLTDYRAVILAGVPSVSEATARQLRAFVQDGGALVIFMGEGVSAEAYNATLLPQGLLPGALVRRITASPDTGSSGTGGRGFTFDFNPRGNLHPLLQLFRGEPRTGLDSAEVFTYWQTEIAPGTERVLDFAGGKEAGKDAAITTRQVGRGHVVFVATSAGADGWTTLPARPVFVTLVQELVAGSLARRDAWMNVRVGDRVEIPSWVRLTGQPVLTDSAGRSVGLSSETGGGVSVWRSDVMTRPGVFVLQGVAGEGSGSAGGGSLPVVVNVDSAAEADVRTVDESAVARALGDVAVEVVRDELPGTSADRGGGTQARRGGADFGWTIMLVVLGLLGAESYLAMRFGRSKG